MRIKYTGKYGEIIDRETLTTGSVGLIIHIETDADWSSLTLTAQFYNGGVPLNQLVFGGTVELPMEMVRATKPVSMVLIGRNQDGTQVQTSVELPLGNVWYGLREGAEAPDRPTPDWQAQIEAGVDNAVSTAAAVEERANNGEFDGASYDHSEEFTTLAAQVQADAQQATAAAQRAEAAAQGVADIGAQVEQVNGLTQRAEAAAGTAANAQAAAAQSAEQAAGSLGTVEADANRAANAAGAADTSRRDAEGAANRAANSENAAAGSAGAAEAAKTEAQNKAASASQSAGQASQSATTATGAAGRATESAQTASTAAGTATSKATEATTQAGKALEQANRASTAAQTATTQATKSQEQADRAKGLADSVGDIVQVGTSLGVKGAKVGDTFRAKQVDAQGRVTQWEPESGFELIYEEEVLKPVASVEKWFSEHYKAMIIGVKCTAPGGQKNDLFLMAGSGTIKGVGVPYNSGANYDSRMKIEEDHGVWDVSGMHGYDSYGVTHCVGPVGCATPVIVGYESFQLPFLERIYVYVLSGTIDIHTKITVWGRK